MPDTPTAEPRHQSGGLAIALAKLNLDALTVTDAVADVAATAGENVTTALRADIKELRGLIQSLQKETRGSIQSLQKETGVSIQSLQREIASLRWMIGIGFTLLSVFIALSTFLDG